VNRQWLYPYYVIGVLLLILFLFGCDSEGGTSFSVTVTVENADGEPIQGASVGVRPCYESGGGVVCGANGLFQGVRAAQNAKAVEVVDWAVDLDDGAALLTWATASETNNAGFEIQRRTGDGDFEQVAFVDGQGTTDRSTEYRYRDDVVGYTAYAYRLVAVSINGNESVAGGPQTVRRPLEPGLRPLSPNPFRDGATFRAQADSVSVLRSTAHALDGTALQTIVERSVGRGVHQFFWSAKDLSPGVYEQRTRLRTAGEVVARDTTYAVIVRDALRAAALGQTDETGTVSTTTRVRFPALYDVPTIEVRDERGIVQGTVSVSPTVEFVVTTETGVETVRRTVAEGENTLTLSLSP
jgi:hypothetical protein